MILMRPFPLYLSFYTEYLRSRQVTKYSLYGKCTAANTSWPTLYIKRNTKIHTPVWCEDFA